MKKMINYSFLVCCLLLGLSGSAHALDACEITCSNGLRCETQSPSASCFCDINGNPSCGSTQPNYVKDNNGNVIANGDAQISEFLSKQRSLSRPKITILQETKK